MKGSGNYLKNQVRKNLAKSLLCLLLFFLIIIASGLEALYILSLGILPEAGLLISLLPLVGFFYYLHKYHVYIGGWNGEKQVTNLLSSKLNDDYILLNDLYLLNGGGDIDHLVFAPGGIFVLETKNWSGVINCNGDLWQRPGKNGFKGSPSRQIKRNVATIKRIIDSSWALRQLGINVEGIVVFTNKYATLHLNDPTVQILKLPQLPEFITARGGSRLHSKEQLETVAKEILKQKR
jgi:hypothetical protein